MAGEKTIIITGANSGLGLHCARKIAERSLAYRVILACNAGTVGTNGGRTPEGFDIVFATNHMGHFLLTNLLLPFMLPSGRVMLVSSDMHSPPGPKLRWPEVNVLAHPDEKQSGEGSRYSYSKLCNLYFAYELSGRLERIGSGITANAFNPGLMTETNFAPGKSRFTPAFLKMVSDRVGSLSQSSKALADLMTEDKYGRLSGQYFDRSTKAVLSSPLSYDRENALDLWTMSAAYTDLKQNETMPDLLLDF